MAKGWIASPLQSHMHGVLGGVAKESPGHWVPCLSLSTSTICTLLDTWTSVFPGDFATTSGMSALKKVKTYLIIHLPYSDVLIHVHELLTRLLSETSEESD